MELALLLLLILPLCSAQRTYYVTTLSTPCPTPEPEACCVLSECVQNVSRYFASNTTLLFLPGIHILETPVRVENVSILTLSGDPSSLPQVTSRIICSSNPAAYFTFDSVLELDISALGFDSCGSGINASVSLIAVYNSQITNCVFQNCSSDALSGAGGALFMQFVGNTAISDCTFFNNSASLGGGVLVLALSDSGVSFFRNEFVNNTALAGGGLYIESSNVTVIENSFVHNTASISGGGVCIRSGNSITFFGETNFVDNTAGLGMGFGGGLYIEDTATVLFNGDTFFGANSADLLGGAMLIYNSSVIFTGSVGVEGSNASYGAAVAIVQSCLSVENATFQDNRGIYGAGIYSREANLTFSEGATLCNNMATLGGAIYASSSNLNFEGSSSLSQNTARNGGGMLLTDDSKINLFPGTKLYFRSNFAQETGGAIIVEESTPLGYCTNSNISLAQVVSSDCFFQLQNQTVILSEVNTFITFENNRAVQGGGDLYGGTVDSCRLRNIMCDGIEGCSGEVFDRVSGDESQSLSVSSDPLRVCLCSNNTLRCGDFFTPIAAYPGQSVSVSATTIGQRDGGTAGVIRAEVLNNKVQVQDLERIQRTNGTCTNLHYTLLTSLQNTEETITLFADGPCQREGRSLVFRVSILPCPPGFQQSEPTLRCVCDERLDDFTDICDIDSQTILRRRGAAFWVGYDSDAQELILHPQCPFDYCTLNQVLVSAIDSDAQCNYNRTGKLCGGCGGNTSLVLGSSRCMQCSNSYLALIIAFAVAGIALVLFVFILKLTVALGTMNALIFYANIVQVNSSIFYPPGSTNILTVFIAWINLDLGIETCFYNGMDAYAKTWLQFVFPVYVWALVGLIIIISHLSQKMTQLLGSNPIAVLATLFLLSYAKVLRTIISALSVTYLQYPDNVNVAVWSLDGNIKYLTGKHIPLFVIALLALLIVFLPYTLFLFLNQWIQVIQDKVEWRIFSWLNKPKIRAFLDAYHAPYSEKHRYWTGLLLLVRCILFLVFATAGDSSVNLLTISSLTTGLLSLVLLTGGVYKSWYLGALETSFFVNLAILTAATYHVKVSGGSQAAVVFFFLSIVFVTFAGIVLYHLYLQIKKTSMWKRLNFAKLKSADDQAQSRDHTEKEETLIIENSGSVTTTYVELREPLLNED